MKRTYPVSELYGINTSQTNPADENISLISFTLAYNKVQQTTLEVKHFQVSTSKINDRGNILSASNNLIRKISDNNFPLLSLGALDQKYQKEIIRLSQAKMIKSTN